MYSTIPKQLRKSRVARSAMFGVVVLVLVDTLQLSVIGYWALRDRSLEYLLLCPPPHPKTWPGKTVISNSVGAGLGW